MVTRGGGHNPMRKLLIGQRGDFVIGAADLERSGNLQVLRLEQNLVTSQLTERRGWDDLGVTGGTLQTLGCELQFRRMVTLQRLQNIFLFHAGYCNARPRLPTDVLPRAPHTNHRTCLA